MLARKERKVCVGGGGVVADECELHCSGGVMMRLRSLSWVEEMCISTRAVILCLPVRSGKLQESRVASSSSSVEEGNAHTGEIVISRKVVMKWGGVK